MNIIDAAVAGILWLTKDIDDTDPGCPDYRSWSDETDEDRCFYYGEHTGRCWYGFLDGQHCPWKGRRYYEQ